MAKLAYKKMMVILPLLAAAGCASDTEEVLVGSANNAGLSAPSDRYLDSTIAGDMDAIQALYARVEKLNAKGRDNRDYHMTKARHWIDFAYDEYTDNDRSGITGAALGQAVRLINEMEGTDAKNTKLSMDTPLVAGSERIREDLWQLSEAYKNHKGFNCAASTIAEFEVQLVWAGHEYSELGWRHAVPNIDRAERLARKGKILLDKCVQLEPYQQQIVKESIKEVVEVPSPPKVQIKEVIRTVIKEVPVEVIREVEVIKEVQVIKEVGTRIPTANAPSITISPAEARDIMPERVHFGRDSAKLSPLSRNLIDEVADVMQLNRDIVILLEGHTDPRRSAAYNAKLSKRRVENVRQYLLGRGIAASRLKGRAVGESKRIVKGCTPKEHALNRRVEIIVLSGGQQIQRSRANNRDVKVDSSQPANCGGK